MDFLKQDILKQFLSWYDLLVLFSENLTSPCYFYGFKIFSWDGTFPEKKSPWLSKLDEKILSWKIFNDSFIYTLYIWYLYTFINTGCYKNDFYFNFTILFSISQVTGKKLKRALRPGVLPCPSCDYKAKDNHDFDKHTFTEHEASRLCTQVSTICICSYSIIMKLQ